MTGFLYYVAAERIRDLEQVADLGLSYAFDDTPTSRGVSGGPDDGNGCVFGAVPPDKLGYYFDRQVWQPVADSSAWVGMYYDDKPTPEDLARVRQISGHYVTFEDYAGRWLIPCARRYVGNGEELPWECNLPTRFALVDGDWQVAGVKEKYAELWGLSGDYMQAMIEAASGKEIQEGTVEYVETSFADLMRLCVVAMQTNYRIGDAELSLLGFMDEESRDRVLDAVIDAPTWTEWVKKNGTVATQGASVGLSL